MSCFLCNSSLGKKLVMSVTGCCLVLFLLFHMAMNFVALISPEGYNTICALLGANWYAVVATVGLAALVVLHFVYALILTINNYRARGTQRYAVTANEPGVEWASKNMLVLGVIVVLGLGLHLVHFWSKMMLVELMGQHQNALGLDPTNGAVLVAYTFSKWYNVWSMFQTVGWANDTWYPRLKCAAKVVSTLVILGFMAVVVAFFVCSLCGGCPAAGCAGCGACH